MREPLLIVCPSCQFAFEYPTLPAALRAQLAASQQEGERLKELLLHEAIGMPRRHGGSCEACTAISNVCRDQRAKAGETQG